MNIDSSIIFWQRFNNSEELKILVYLISNADDETGNIAISRNELIKACSTSERQTRTALEHLIKDGIISRCVQENVQENVQDGVSPKNLYHINIYGASKKQTSKKASKKTSKENNTKHRYGNYGKVAMTDDEVERLVSEYGKDKTESFIKTLDEYKQMHGKSYKDDYLAIRKWVIDNVLSNTRQPQRNTTTDISEKRFDNF